MQAAHRLFTAHRATLWCPPHRSFAGSWAHFATKCCRWKQSTCVTRCKPAGRIFTNRPGSRSSGRSLRRALSGGDKPKNH